jgi:hypothetical protein
MNVYRQTCHNCGTRRVRNILVREEGKGDEVYVQCDGCRELVARYVIAPQGYYHHGKDFESYLRGLKRGGHFDSGKDMDAQFEKVKEECVTEFQEVLKKLEEKKGDDPK